MALMSEFFGVLAEKDKLIEALEAENRKLKIRRPTSDYYKATIERHFAVVNEKIRLENDKIRRLARVISQNGGLPN
ncbi:MAG: hypothetical protein OXC41_09865 [Gammaproteobacteria bacterium]|nr:hypothetical protein [Gammaproteobacteria bacterium]